jgi:sodium/bile acid cotransporter 7
MGKTRVTPVAFLQKNWFFFGILAALVLGFFLSDLEGVLNPRSITRNTLIVLLFLISGFTLPSEAIVGGLKELRLHLFVQLFIFLFAPAFFVLTSLPFRGLWDPELLIGIYALSCLPTTISSCIVFTQVSGGNVMGTMFNAALANLVGVVLSPLLLSLLMRETGRPLPVSELLSILGDLGLLMLLPIAAGQILRRILCRVANAHKRRLSVASSLFILLIVFFSFARTAQNPEFMGNLRSMLAPFGYLAVAHLALLGLAYAGARALRFSPQSTVSVLYAAPQKTLAVGAPLLSAYFTGSPELLGVALLPLLFYHVWQLVVAGFVRSSPLVARLQRTAAPSQAAALSRKAEQPGEPR